MLASRKFMINAVLIILIPVLILICPGPVQTSAEALPSKYEIPVSNMPLTQKTEDDIWKLCERNNLSYALVLAVFQAGGGNHAQINDINTLIDELASYRDYWTEQGYSDEMVFDLIIISQQRGIDGCKIFLKNNSTFDNDKYVQKVTTYKYFLDQNDSEGRFI